MSDARIQFRLPAASLFGVFAVGQFRVVGMPNRILKLGRQFVPFENYLLRCFHW
jgi:hypothetical protein